MKKLLFICLILMVSFVCFAAQYHTVSVDHEAYRIIDSAAIRGIIPMQTTVKPYSLSKVRSLLESIVASGKVSAGEEKQIFLMLDDFDRLYGKEESKDKSSIMKNVFFRDTFGKDTSVTLGLKLKTVQTVGIELSNITSESKDIEKFWDSRNSMTFFANGDLFGYASFDVNLGLLYDKLCPKAFLATDFTFEGDGTYQSMGNASPGSMTEDMWTQRFFMGFHYEPEVSTSLFDDRLSIRYANICRDWGTGVNNLQLSKTAGTIDGFEFTVSPVSWFDYSVMYGSLGKANFGTVNGVQYPSDLFHNDYYNNNITAHKAEIRPVKNVSLDVWESVVYRKRFELGYLNPFGIYMFAQNVYSDYDNVIAGADITVNLFNFQFYAGVGMDEIGSPKPKRIFKDPRNLISYQAGVKFSAPELEFSTITAQVTYVPAFFGAHYMTTDDNNPAGFDGWTTAFVNKGHLIGYPVNPDTLEVLMQYDGTVAESLDLNLTLKDQMRSYQYATHSTGTDILNVMNYDRYNEYTDRAFFKNIAQNTVDVEVNATKKFYGTPVSVSGSLQFIMDSNRGASANYSAYSYKINEVNTGNTFDFSNYSWETTYDFNFGLGVKINY